MILQSHIHALRPLTTAHLAQTMTLLGLSAFELRQKVEAELASNPALELVSERICPGCKRRLPAASPCPVCSRPTFTSGDQPIVFVSPREDFFAYGGREWKDEDTTQDELVRATEDLPTYVLRQIAPELPAEDRALAAHILTSLDDDGLLQVPVIEIARYHHVLISRVQKVIALIQRADPIGVGSSSPQEALLVQLSVLEETHKVPALADTAVQQGMDLLSRHAYQELGRLLGTSARQAQLIARFISDNLNPFPARSHWGDTHESAEQTRGVYHQADILISRLDNREETPLVVEIASPYSGALRVNPLFRQALASAPETKAEAWQADLEQASLLVKCLQQRDHTLVRLMQRLVVLQREFLLKGDAYLAPITRARLAEELEVHESTISRAVSSKAVQLPNRRIVPLSKLFDRSLSVRTAVRAIIDGEVEPLSDTQICQRLRDQGFDVARRTVAKYRAMEGILPARYRQTLALAQT